MTDNDRNPARALSFGSAAARYDQMRPRYPAEAVRWAVGDQPRQVVDLAAGTGILSRVLVGLGHQVTAVEPDPAMRAHLVAVSPQVPALAGVAEQIPLPDASVDAVLAGQAYHWFDPPRAHPEIARVLRPGGIFAALWNSRDESVPWVAALSALADSVRGQRGVSDPAPGLSSLGPAFGPVQKAVFTHATPHTPDSLVALISTRSYYLISPPQQQRELEQAIRDLCATHPDLAGRARFDLPYQTIGYRAATVPAR